jgi:quercetin dioxygenase-like cupin family protein
MSFSMNAGAGDAGRTISDPTAGEEITFVETAEESGGDRVVLGIRLAPGTVVPPHAHRIREDFECLEGQLEFRLNGRPIELRSGSTVSVPVNQVHFPPLPVRPSGTSQGVTS